MKTVEIISNGVDYHTCHQCITAMYTPFLWGRGEAPETWGDEQERRWCEAKIRGQRDRKSLGKKEAPCPNCGIRDAVIADGKTCYCETCNKWFNPLGIARHRAMHRERKEDCTIMYTNGDSYLHEFSKWKRVKACEGEEDEARKEKDVSDDK